MEKSKKLVFDPHGKYTVSKEFKLNGRNFTPGASFPWRQLSISQRRARQLYEDNKISMSGRGIVPPPPIKTQDGVDPTRPWEGPIGGNEIKDPEISRPEFIFDPEIHTIDNPERGIWLIMKGDQTMLRVSRREAKRLEKRSNPDPVREDQIVG
jgi:hypothetical protein